MKLVILLMFLIYVGTMFFLIYMRLRPVLKEKKPPQRADGVQQRDEQQDEGDE